MKENNNNNFKQIIRGAREALLNIVSVFCFFVLRSVNRIKFKGGRYFSVPNCFC